MTPEYLTISFIFVFLLGGQIGRILTLHQQARKTVEAIECLMEAKWLTPQVLAAQLHQDQEALPEVGPLRLTITEQCRMIHAGVRAR